MSKKKYKHLNGSCAIYKETIEGDNIYNVFDSEQDQDNKPWFTMLESHLKSFGFVEQLIIDTGNDWVDKAYLYFYSQARLEFNKDEKVFREAIEKHMPQQLKPLDVDNIASVVMDSILERNGDSMSPHQMYVKTKELLSQYGVPSNNIKPLDKISNYDIEMWCRENVKEDYDIPKEFIKHKVSYYIMKFVSQYGVQEQEEDDDKRLRHDREIDEAFHKGYRSCLDDIKSKKAPVTSTIEELADKIGVMKIKEILSSLSPIEKKQKFTKEYVWNSMKELPCITGLMINQTYKFLEKEGLLKE